MPLPLLEEPHICRGVGFEPQPERKEGTDLDTLLYFLLGAVEQCIQGNLLTTFPQHCLLMVMTDRMPP